MNYETLQVLLLARLRKLSSCTEEQQEELLVPLGDHH